MGLSKHQGSHCRDYNTHISPWQLPFQRMTSRQDPVRGGIQWHFLSPLQTLIAYTVTAFTTPCQFMGIRCLHILSQHLKTGLRFSHIIAPDVWLVGIVTEATTQTEKDSREVLWSHVLSERLLFIVHDPFHSLLLMERSGTHGDMLLDALCLSGWVLLLIMWNRSQALFEESHSLSKRQKNKTKQNIRKRLMRWIIFLTSLGQSQFHELMYFWCRRSRFN